MSLKAKVKELTSTLKGRINITIPVKYLHSYSYDVYQQSIYAKALEDYIILYYPCIDSKPWETGHEDVVKYKITDGKVTLPKIFGKKMIIKIESNYLKPHPSQVSQFDFKSYYKMYKAKDGEIIVYKMLRDTDGEIEEILRYKDEGFVFVDGGDRRDLAMFVGMIITTRSTKEQWGRYDCYDHDIGGVGFTKKMNENNSMEIPEKMEAFQDVKIYPVTYIGYREKYDFFDPRIATIGHEIMTEHAYNVWLNILNSKNCEL